MHGSNRSVYSGILSLALALGATALLPASGASAQGRHDAAASGQPHRFSDADEALYRERFEALRQARRLGRGLDDYDPLEPVAGAQPARWMPQAQAAQRSVPEQALLRASRHAEQMNSSALLVWRHGMLEHEDYFGGTTRESLLVSRSLAKPLTAIAVGRAIALGFIRDLDQPVAEFVHEWRGDALRERMLVRHLLDMRTGFLPQARSDDPESPLNRAYLHPRHDEVIIHEYPVVDMPGTRFEYSNATSELVAVVLERATGSRYGTFISEQVLAPLGAAGGQIWVNREGGVAHSGCCILLPAQSWLKLAVLLLQDGTWEGRRLLPEGFVTAMTTPTAQNIRYGLGVYVAGPWVERRGFTNPERPLALSRPVLHSEPYLADDLFLFDGNGHQVVYIIPSEGLVILRTGSVPTGDREWDNSYLPNLLLGSLPELRAVPQPRP